MKRFVLILSLLLLLTGCGTSAETEHVPKADAAENTGALPLPVTEESIRAACEADGFTVREIKPFGKDFLVYGGYMPQNGQFDWIYGETGQRCPLVFCIRSVLSYKIRDVGQIEVLLGTENPFNSHRSFPYLLTAYAAQRLDEKGTPYPADFQEGNFVEEPYWAPVSEAYTIGWRRPETLADARMSLNGIEVTFGPQLDRDMGNFFAAVSSIPQVDISYDSANKRMTLTCHSTRLDSGVPSPDDSYASMFSPTSFPAGVLETSNDFISRAEIQEVGENVVIALTLTDRAVEYTIEEGQLLWDESRPYLSLRFREAY